MAKQKAVNWPAIKARYLRGEKPKDIAKDYNVTANQISEKARRENWKPKKAKINQKVEADVQAELQTLAAKKLALAHLSLDTSLYGLTVVARKMAETNNPYRQDGDGLPDAFFLEAVKAGKEAAKIEETKTSGTETSRPVYNTIYETGESHAAPTRNFASKAILPVESGDSREEEWEDDRSD